MDRLDSSSGDKVAQALDRRIVNVAKEVYNNAPYTIIRLGKIKEIDSKNYTVEIQKATYTKIKALKNVGTININDVVVCVVPNNQFSNMFIIGVIDN